MLVVQKDVHIHIYIYIIDYIYTGSNDEMANQTAIQLEPLKLEMPNPRNEGNATNDTENIGNSLPHCHSTRASLDRVVMEMKDT